MPRPRFTNEWIIRFESLYQDKIVIINIENGQYEIDGDALTASI